jgi:hypothetical protein
MTAAPHNAPPYILAAMHDSDDLPLLRAVKAIGDGATWLGTAPHGNGKYGDDAVTCWSLDGGKTHATHGEIMKAAGLK